MPKAQNYYPSCPETLVVALARTGDRKAIEDLVMRRQAWIRSLIRRCCSDATLADDLAQQVFLRMWLKIRLIKNPLAFPAWLRRLAVSIWLQYLRKHDALRNASVFKDFARPGSEALGVLQAGKYSNYSADADVSESMNRQERRAEKARKRKKKGAGQSLSDATQMAKEMHQAGNLKEAESIYRRIIKASPNRADALNYLGILLNQTNRSEEAVTVLKQSISVSPDYVDAHNNLGIVLKELERFDEAAEAFEACLALSPGHVNALNNYGTNFRAQEKYEKAIEFYNRAIQLDPELSDAYVNLGYSLRKLSRLDDAVAAYLKAIELRPYDPTAYRTLGLLLYVEKREKEAIGLFEKWLEIDPENPTALHLYAAFSGDNVPSRASENYITQTFNSFASTFDTVLRDLDYRAPELVAKAVGKYYESKTKQLDILDAGCGTGLLAPLVQDYAKTLVGVDLSSEMINKASGLNIYTQLHVDELTRFILSHPDHYDLILSVDTLIYFGDLEDVIKAAHYALKANGRLIMTLEKCIDPAPGEKYRLNPHGRYSHSREYLETCLCAHGFMLQSIEYDILRVEAGEPVQGMVIVAHPARIHPQTSNSPTLG